METTRYTATNVSLMVAAGLLIAFLSVMTAGFGADPAHDFVSTCIVVLLVVSLLSVPAYLAMFRWCLVASISMWCITGLCLLLALLSGLAGPSLALFFLMALDASLFQAIVSNSHRRSQLHPA
jgi:hypothetical protein